MRLLLHVGCGSAPLPEMFPAGEWEEVRVDIDPHVCPHVCASIADMPFKDGIADAVYSSHNLEHLADHEVLPALKEFYRVLKPGGTLILCCPDAGAAMQVGIKQGFDATLYVSPAGPIAAADIIWGHRGIIAQGNECYRHKTGFTRDRLLKFLFEAGFPNPDVTGNFEKLELYVIAAK